MTDNTDRLYSKFTVIDKRNSTPVPNPDECIVLKFNDPVAKRALWQWADDLEAWGLPNAANEVRQKLGERPT